MTGLSVPFWNHGWVDIWTAVKPSSPGVRLSKIVHYLGDNEYSSRISYLKWAVNEEMRCGAGL
jgi:hypothetical protein